MMPYGDTSMAGEAGKEWYRHRTKGREGGVGSISKIFNNKRWSLGPAW